VHELTATAWRARTILRTFVSKRPTLGPVVSHPDRMAAAAWAISRPSVQGL